MQTGTAPSELPGRVKKIKQYEPVCFILLLTKLAGNLDLFDLRLGTVCFERYGNVLQRINGC
jgi:hypothetical protein